MPREAPGIDPARGRRPRPRAADAENPNVQAGYAGLARIRSAGELVVGLDQNNLPFSTAHPEPAGLDYEIAGLLAEQLGVTLRVYWALSAHDSYPSKLSAKGLCDVILGVMPDDRFEQPGPLFAALLSREVSTGRPGRRRSAAGQRAGGRGGRGCGARARRARGAAVSQHRSDSGSRRDRSGEGRLCDLDTRALAGPGALAGKARLPRRRESVDCFPISAAVRKSDRDLKDAIDRAWDELDRSGRLAQVFARWHIPYERIAAADASESQSREPIRTGMLLESTLQWLGVGLLGWVADPGCSAGGRSGTAGTAAPRRAGTESRRSGGRPGTLSGFMQWLSRRRRPRRQRP